jgi:hypothetical protein
VDCATRLRTPGGATIDLSFSSARGRGGPRLGLPLGTRRRHWDQARRARVSAHLDCGSVACFIGEPSLARPSGSDGRRRRSSRCGRRPPPTPASPKPRGGGGAGLDLGNGPRYGDQVTRARPPSRSRRTDCPWAATSKIAWATIFKLETGSSSSERANSAVRSAFGVTAVGATAAHNARAQPVVSHREIRITCHVARRTCCAASPS